MPTERSSVRVLLVEDSPSDARLLCEALSGYPLQTFVIEDVERLDQALRLLAEKVFDVVLLDLNLPDSTGLTTCTKVRAAAPHTPVVVLTGADDEKVALEALRQGVQDYLVKGQISGGPLGRAVHYAVERQQAKNALREAHERLQAQAEELRAANEELNAQAEELQAANEELRNNEEALRQLNAGLEQRVAEQTREIRRAYDRLHDVLEMLPAYVVLLTPDHHVPFANRFFRERFGESYGRRCYEYLFGRQEPCEVCGTFTVLQTGQPYRWEWLGPDGRNYDIHDFPFTDTDGAPLIMEMGIDITERKRAESALKEANETLEQRVADRTAELATSEGRLRMALEGGQMGRWEWDLQADAVFWDERTRELLGVSPELPARSETFFQVVDSRDREALRELVARTLGEQEDFQAEFRIARRDAEPAWRVSRGKVVRDPTGRAVRMIGVMYDVTPRKQLEAELRRLNDQLEVEVQAQTEELRDTVDRLQDEVVRRVLAEGKLRRRSQMLEAFFQHTITPLAFLDRQFNFVRVNEAYARADNKSPEHFVGKNHFALYPHDENRALFEQVVRTRQPYHAYARPFRYPDDPQRVTYWNWQLTPLLDERGQVQFLVFNLEDVTERQKAFQELEHRARQLQKLTLELSQAEDRERKRLAEILHDDLQQQLAATKFHLGILSNRVKHDGTLQEMVARMHDMLREAIEKSRSLSHELSPVVLYQSDLGETLEWLGRQVQTKHGLTVHVEVRGRIDSPSEPLKAFLYRAAQEILFNVVKHARTKEATVRLQRMHEEIWLTISDKGQGFDPQMLSKTSGFGLLSIRERVELLGGRMKIKSIASRGSTFLIAVPDAMTPGRVEGGTSAVGTVRGELLLGRHKFATSAESPRLRVLLVDDHEVMREGLAALLKEQQDMEIIGQAGNGREAVDLACRFEPDVIIMDAAMPVMSGEEATRQIKRQLPRTRVVALSMFGAAEMAEKMRRAGAAAYLLKTAPSEELLAAIRARDQEVDTERPGE